MSRFSTQAPSYCVIEKRFINDTGSVASGWMMIGLSVFSRIVVKKVLEPREESQSYVKNNVLGTGLASKPSRRNQ